MNRFAWVAAAAALSFTHATATAQTAHGYYTATPVTAPEKAKIVTRTTIWKCGEGVCVASKAFSRDTIMCELVAMEVGVLSAFTVQGVAFDAEALAKCNARAR